MLVITGSTTGSSPGRKGFKMAVTAGGRTAGSIGGGIMEHNMAGLAVDLLKKGQTKCVLKKQVHSERAGTDASGLICAGEQTNILVPIPPDKASQLESIAERVEGGEKLVVRISPDGIEFKASLPEGQVQGLSESAGSWSYYEVILPRPELYIFGGGHISIPLSQLARMLDFKVIILDDRRELHTFTGNTYAHIKKIIDYQVAEHEITHPGNSFVVIMTNSHEKDQLILERLINLPLSYLGMIGSSRKVEKIFSNLKKSGISETVLHKVKSPIGINIGAQTPAEIAVSIAAQLIGEKREKKE